MCIGEEIQGGETRGVPVLLRLHAHAGQSPSAGGLCLCVFVMHSMSAVMLSVGGAFVHAFRVYM